MAVVCDLTDKKCVPCEGGVPPLPAEEAANLLKQLHSDWQITDDGTTLTRRLTFKGFAKPLLHANMAAFVGDQEGHHPDIAFGWGYTEVKFTTHAIGGLTENDFICAAKFDRAASGE